MGQKILLNLPEKDLEKIESLVKAGEYATKSEVIRYAIKQLIYSEERMKVFNQMAKKLQDQSKARKLNRKDIEKETEEAKEETRKEISKMIK